MRGMFLIHYYLVNVPYGCYECFKLKETALSKFEKMKSNGKYQKIVLFDNNGKKLDEFVS